MSYDPDAESVCERSNTVTQRLWALNKFVRQGLTLPDGMDSELRNRLHKDYASTLEGVLEAVRKIADNSSE